MIKERNASKDIRKLNLESKAIYVQKGILFSAFYWVWLGLYLTSKREHSPTEQHSIILILSILYRHKFTHKPKRYLYDSRVVDTKEGALEWSSCSRSFIFRGYFRNVS